MYAKHIKYLCPSFFHHHQKQLPPPDAEEQGHWTAAMSSAFGSAPAASGLQLGYQRELACLAHCEGVSTASLTMGPVSGPPSCSPPPRIPIYLCDQNTSSEQTAESRRAASQASPSSAERGTRLQQAGFSGDTAAPS
ncbi:hypothetical protein EYF80_008131 [Liparis tanakae]|uniref:Uncharacterized protein n=1 Tax=Liparis tanakae TaxID=230148 RepID=A0A4Z2IUS8_9TELE|nr:hypothetical protein EYF80_008131 [Liparis tanakae]